MMRLPETETLIRWAVAFTVTGLLCLVPVLLAISALAVGLYMVGAALIAAGVVLYVIGVVRDLRRYQAL